MLSYTFIEILTDCIATASYCNSCPSHTCDNIKRLFLFLKKILKKVILLVFLIIPNAHFYIGKKESWRTSSEETCWGLFLLPSCGSHPYIVNTHDNVSSHVSSHVCDEKHMQLLKYFPNEKQHEPQPTVQTILFKHVM